MKSKPNKVFRNHTIDDVRIKREPMKQKTKCYYCNDLCMMNNPTISGNKTKYLCNNCNDEMENGK